MKHFEMIIKMLNYVELFRLRFFWSFQAKVKLHDEKGKPQLKLTGL